MRDALKTATVTRERRQLFDDDANRIPFSQLVIIKKWKLDSEVARMGSEKTANAPTWDLMGEKTDVQRLVSFWSHDSLPSRRGIENVFELHAVNAPE